MGKLHSQRGATLISMLALALMLGTLVTMGLRLAPAYLEYRSVRSILLTIAGDQSLREAPIRDVRLRLDNLFNTNQINALRPAEVKITRDRGRLELDGRYEVRTHLIANIDAVIRFEDLQFVIGE